MAKPWTAQQIAEFDQGLAGASKELDQLLVVLQTSINESGLAQGSANTALFIITKLNKEATGGLLITAMLRLLASENN